MARKLKRPRGAPKGNSNAVKHGYYSRAFNEAEQYDFNLAAGMEGISEEIALLRFEIKKAVSGGDIRNLMPLVKAAFALEKLLRTHHLIISEKQTVFKDAMENVMRDVLAPLGTGAVNSVISAKLSGSAAPDINEKNQKTNTPENEAGLTYNK